MHDKAELVKGSGLIGPPRDGVAIEAVEAVYRTSSQANAKEKFRCSGCGVRVIAVITAATKTGRKKSPSSYFKATPNSHKKSCKPSLTVSAPVPAPAPVTKAASPTKAALPTEWDDAPATVVTTPTKGAVGSGHGSGAGSGSRASTSGTGTSRSKSKRVERFAAEWKLMSPAQRASTPLHAPSWNPGGTYDSAFFDLTTTTLTSSPSSRKAIYRGTMSSAKKFKTGYVLTLQEKHNDGLELSVWVLSDVSTSDPAGKDLWDRLEKGLVPPGSEVFALGEFGINHRPKVSWYSIPVAAGNHLWVP